MIVPVFALLLMGESFQLLSQLTPELPPLSSQKEAD